MEKIQFADIFDTEFYNGDWLPYYAGVWIIKNDDNWSGILDPVFDGTNYQFQGFETSQVLNLTVDNAIYQDTSGASDPLQEVINNDGTYYFDPATRILYAHFTDNVLPQSLRLDAVEIGILKVFYRTETFIDQYQLSQIIQGQIAENRLISTPTARTELDDFFYSKPKYINGVIKIDNTDLKYKNMFVGKNRPESLSQVSKIGNLMRVYEWEGDSILNDMTWDALQENITYQGVVDKGAETYEDPYTVDFSVRDIRQNFNIKSPKRTLDNTQWPDIKDPDTTVDLPNIWGTCRRVPVLCLNEQESSPTEFQFLLADTADRPLKRILRVYVDDVLLDIVAPTIIKDATQGISYFEVDDGEFFDGNRYTGLTKVSVDIEGYTRNDMSETLITNTLEIVRTMQLDDLGYIYSEAFYDIDQWQSVEDTAPNAGYFIKSPTELYRRIADLQTNIPGTKWDITAQRRNTWFDFRYTGQDPIFTIDSTMLPRPFSPTLSIDSDEVLASFRVGYAKKWSGSDVEYSYYTDDSNSDFASSEYRTDKSRDFDTFLSDETDAIDQADIIAGRVSIADNRFKVDVDTNAQSLGLRASQLRGGDFIRVIVDLDTEELIGSVTCQIERQENRDGRTRLNLRVEQSAPDNFIQNRYLIFTENNENKYLILSGLPLILGD
jgi:hypothetical protein